MFKLQPDSDLTAREIGELYRRFGPLVRRRCTRIVGSASAEDATQEVFLRLYRYRRSFDRAPSKLQWLYRVADTCCFLALNRQKARREETDVLLPQIPDHRTNAEQATEDKDLVLQFLADFDDRVKQVAVLRYLDGLTQEEIAQATGWSRQTVVNKLKLLETHAEKFRAQLIAVGSEGI